MGLNEFVSLFYGSAQNLNASSSRKSTSTSTSTYSLPTAADVHELRQMLKNHKNAQAKKYSYKDYPNDMKYGKNLNAAVAQHSIYATTQPVNAAAKKLLNHHNSNSNNNNNNAGQAGKLPPATRIPTKLTAAATSCSNSSSSNSHDMDVQRGKHKSATSASSFLWNSFRLPQSLRSGVDQTELQDFGLGLILSPVASAAQTPRDSKRASLGNNELPCICGADNNSCNCAAEKAPKDQNGTQPSTAQSKHRAVEEDIVALNPALKRYMDNGYLNYERLAKCLEANSQWLEEGQRQTTGLAIVVQFMSKQMDMLSCEEGKAKDKLEETMALLQQTQHSCEELQQQLHKKDMEWTQRQQERDHQQRSELQQAQDKVQEMQMIAKERFQDFESQLLAKDEEKKQALQSYHQEVAHQLRHKQDQLSVAEQQVAQLQSRLQEHELQQQQLHEQLTQAENKHATRLEAATQREDEQQERIKSLTKELQSLRASNEHNERDLRDRLALSQDEISVLRSSTQRRRAAAAAAAADTNAEMCRLTSEAESLRCVLELKQAEISTLSKQNAELQRENDEQRGLSSRVTLLVAQNEMLRTELEAKTEKEKDLQRQMDDIQKAFNHENIKRKRLTCDKEELQYHLKQRSEQLQLVQAQLHDLSQNHSYSRSNSSLLNNTSPPTSPVIKGVIERNDSVSWVLEMDDETPQVAASKLVRRAGSLRSNSERSPTQRRQLQLLSLSANAASSGCGSSSSSNGHGNGHHGPNPLSQSMSATALMRSNSSNNQQEQDTLRPLCRARSQSVCNKEIIQPSKHRQSSDLALPEWHVAELTASSPQHAQHAASAGAAVEMRSRTSTMKLMSCVDAYPKALKKFQEIQESAGEAMVSGANSEDESCSASSEDMRSSSASSTASAAGCNLSKRQKQPSRMSIEEALLLEQVNGGSMNGTPMEVSWSEDAADADVA
ncbi:GH10288 [Drosophila grimshawi]|uniref:GH10288 n=1 Tax=Drosophila grimshawi TaxID=7222 RepID=B4JAN2_DROGR|nr:GH10288 [Drosophila grimshawi]